MTWTRRGEPFDHTSLWALPIALVIVPPAGAPIRAGRNRGDNQPAQGRNRLRADRQSRGLTQV
jgi:hypothetical protein